MSKDYYVYENARKTLYNKDFYIKNFISTMLNRTQRMFKYSGLPITIPQFELEKLLQVNGFAYVTKVDGNLYAFTGGLGGIPNEYYEPTKIAISNPYLKFNAELDIEKDGVLIKNDTFMNGLMPILQKSAVMNCDCDITLNMLATILRVQYLISGSDNKTQKNAELFLSKIKNGDMSIVGESDFTDGIKFQSFNGNLQIVQQFIQLSQFLQAKAYNDIGIDANFNMKKERLITSEINVNEPSLLPMVENMLDERRNAVEKINAMYGANITVELNCVWKQLAETHELEATELNKEVSDEVSDDTDEVSDEVSDDTDEVSDEVSDEDTDKNK